MSEFHLVVSREPTALPTLRRRLRAWLDEQQSPLELRDQIVLAVHEAAVNVVEHTAGGPFEVCASSQGGVVSIEVRNEGPWAEISSLDGAGGGGLELIENLVEELEILRSAGGTIVRMRQSLLS